MDYQLVSEATGDTVHLSSREWEMLRELARQPAGWKPKEDKDYTRGTIPAEEAAVMAHSVEVSFPHLRRERDVEKAREARTLQELEESLGYIEGDPLTFFGDDARRRKVEVFIKLASVGALEVLPNPRGTL